jgi:hypothetical protein
MDSLQRRYAHLNCTKKIDLSKPLVNWTPVEEEFARRVIQRHFDEDR